MAPKWTCSLCCVDRRGYTGIHLEEVVVCCVCIKRLFQEARDFEHRYPPKLGALVLHACHFSDILGEQFLAEYTEKEHEYWAPPTRRVYCAGDKSSSSTEQPAVKEICNTFVGTRTDYTSKILFVVGKCPRCHQLTCMGCEAKHESATAACAHEWNGSSIRDEEDKKAFKGLQKGKDYQVCPNHECHRKIELAEACNHVTCMCDTEFCFICGEDVSCEEDHWTRNKCCPEYGQPQDGNADYDPETVVGGDWGEQNKQARMMNQRLRDQCDQEQVPIVDVVHRRIYPTEDPEDETIPAEVSEDGGCDWGLGPANTTEANDGGLMIQTQEIPPTRVGGLEMSEEERALDQVLWEILLLAI